MNKVERSGVIRENLGIALDIIRAHKLRSSLIILGVAIGVASLMGMVSILLGLGEKITHDITSSERPFVALVKYDFLVGGFDASMLRRRDITIEDARAVRESCPSVRYVCFDVIPQGRPPQILRYQDEKSRMIQIIGTQSTLFNIWGLDVQEGRMFTEEEVSRRARVIVLGHSPRRDLFPLVDPIGKRIKVGDEDFTVIGTLEKRNTLFGDFADNFALIPYTAYMSTFWREQDMQRVLASVREGATVEQAVEEITRVMRVRRKLKADEENDFTVTSSDAVLEFMARITGPIALILAAISSIGLLVGGIGVMNMMLVSVTERTGEIGIRKAVGATRMDILYQFLIEAGTLTGIGGFLGVILGTSAAKAVSALSGLPSILSPFYIVLAVAFSISIGIFFGLYPANRASRLDPVEAMGYAK